MTKKWFVCGLVVCHLIPVSNALADEREPKERSSNEDFRSRWESDRRMRNLYRSQDEHQISLSFGNVSGEATYSALKGESSKAKTASLITRLSYCFYIPQAKWLALGLGTSMGYEARQDRSIQLREGITYHLPGLLVAANVRLASNAQMIFGIDHSIERWEKLGVDERFDENAQSQDLRQSPVSVNLRLTDLFASFVWRWDLSWGVSLEMHRRFARFFKPGDADGKAVNVEIGHRDLWVGSGVTYLLH